MIRKRHMFGRAKAAAGRPSDSSCAQACEAGCGNGIEDGILVDAVDAMQVGQVLRLPEMLDAKRLQIFETSNIQSSRMSFRDDRKGDRLLMCAWCALDRFIRCRSAHL